MKRQALVVGINRYPFLTNNHLYAPYYDATNIATLLNRSQGNPDFAWSVDDRLLSSQENQKVVSTEELSQAIHHLFQPKTQTLPDVALFFFAGHGIPGTDGRIYLAASDANPSKSQWGFPLEQLRELMLNSPISQQVVFLDCCHSGDLLNLTSDYVKKWKLGGDRLIIVAESWVVKVLGNRPIFQAVMRLGWLNRVERFPEAICVFYHASFQEYFAALAVDDWDYFLPRNHVNFPVAGKEYRIFEPQWKQVILLWLGRGDVEDEEKEEFIEKLVNFDDGCSDFYKQISSSLASSLLAQKLNDKKVKEFSGVWESLNEDEHYVVNLPYHLVHAEMGDDLYEIVNDVDFISFYQFYQSSKPNQTWLWLDDLSYILSKGIFSARFFYLFRTSINNKITSFMQYCLSCLSPKSPKDCLVNVAESTIRLQSIYKNHILFWILFILNSFWTINKETNHIESFDFDNAAYIVIRHCAQNLPYPDFYRTWHSLSETQTSPNKIIGGSLDFAQAKAKRTGGKLLICPITAKPLASTGARLPANGIESVCSSQTAPNAKPI